MAARSYRDLIAWQKAMNFAESVYRKTACFPKEETYGLRAQLRASAASVLSNIAEGQGRRSTKEFRHFLSIAYGSLCEAQTQILLSERLSYLTSKDAADLIAGSEEVGRLVNGLFTSLRRKSGQAE
jgi:four helix bundle protein